MITMDITLVIQMINIIVLMFILNAVLYKPVLGIIRARREKMQRTQEEIHTFDKNSRARQEELDRKLAEASAKAKTALDTARADAAAAGNEKLAAIKTQAEADKEKKMTVLKNEVAAAEKGLHDSLSGFADDMAGKILGRSL